MTLLQFTKVDADDRQVRVTVPVGAVDYLMDLGVAGTSVGTTGGMCFLAAMPYEDVRKMVQLALDEDELNRKRGYEN